MEHVEAGPTDLVEDPAIQQKRGPDTQPRPGLQQCQARQRRLVVPERPGTFETHECPYGRRSFVSFRLRHQLGRGDAEAVQIRLGQVDPAAGEVLGDVSDEVGQLERQAQFPRAVPDRLRSAPATAPSIGSIIVPITAAEPSMYVSRSA